jgi:hypothetical protein
MYELFRLGKLVATPAALKALDKSATRIETILAQHCTQHWGDICKEDRQENDKALRTNSRIFSVYNIPFGVRLFVITEADRSATTVLLESEY